MSGIDCVAAISPPDETGSVMGAGGDERMKYFRKV
jgi:hypothetical protein